MEVPDIPLKTSLTETEMLRLKRPVSREKFRKCAKPIPLKIGRTLIREAVPRESKRTSSLGWGLNTKIYVNLGGKPVQVQVNFSMTIIGSKKAPEQISSDDDAADQEHI